MVEDRGTKRFIHHSHSKKIFQVLENISVYKQMRHIESHIGMTRKAAICDIM